MSLKKDIVWRVAVIYLGLVVLGLAILGRIVYLQFVEGGKWEQLAVKQTLKDFVIKPNRGDILSDDGRLLASSVPYYDIRVDFHSNALNPDDFWNNIDSLSMRLADLFGDKPAYVYKSELLKAFRNKNRYYLLKRSISYRQMKALKSFPLFSYGRYKGGLIVVESNRRIRPQRELAARTIGYVTESLEGNVVGIEGAYDGALSGKIGYRLMQRLSGNVWMPVNDNNEVEPLDGMDVETTVNIDIQDVAEHALMKQLIKHDANHGTVVLMQVHTGEVKAIANLEKDKDGNYRELYNYAIGESVEPGSTFKLPVLLAALEDGAVNLTDTIDTGNGKIKFYNKTIRDTRKGGYGKLTVKQVFEYSSNVGMAKLITDHYKDHPQDLIDRLYSMGLNRKLGIEIKGEGTPVIQYPGDKYWSGISLPMISHGYEVRLTPLQILAFYNAIANNGVMVKPKFVKAIKFHGRTLKTFGTEVLNPSVCSKETLAKAREMLEGVVENGTAKNLRNNVYKIAGKTGTAQIANEKYGYRVNARVSYMASFVGYFPAEDPEYSCIVMVSAPSNAVYYGNLVAGPVFREVADKVYATNLSMQKEFLAYAEHPHFAPYCKNGKTTSLLDVLHTVNVPVSVEKKQSNIPGWSITICEDSVVVVKPLPIRQRLMPNVVGMGLKDALYLLNINGIRVDAAGWGTVKAQSLSPGSIIEKNEHVVLTMSIN
ncbi:MAG: transpeptidase family protein [Chlorobi bacterium]|nr:transpeptidase family protein [Chlorobiota bacterium]